MRASGYSRAASPGSIPILRNEMSRQVAPLLYSSGLITQGPGCEPGIKVYYINQYLWGLRYFAACFPRARAEFVFYNFFFGFCATRLGLLFILFLDIL